MRSTIRRPKEGNEEQRMLAAVARAFVDDVVEPRAQHYRDLPRSERPSMAEAAGFLAQADAMGLRSLGIAERFGGTPADPLTQALCVEELSRGDAGLALSFAQSWLLGGVIAATGRPSLLDGWLRLHLEEPGALLATSPVELRRVADSPAGGLPALRLTTGSSGERWIVEGEVRGVQAGSVAGAFVLPAARDDGDPVLLLVPRDLDGVTVRDVPDISQGIQSAADLDLKGVRLPDHNVLDGAVDPVPAVRAYARDWTLLEAAAAVGVGQALFDAALRQVSERVQGGQLIIHHQAVAELVAEMATGLETMRAITYRAARAVTDRWEDATTLVLAARLESGEAATRLGRRCMELYGGSGIMREIGVEERFRQAVTLRNGADRDAQRFALVQSVAQRAPEDYLGPEDLVEVFARER